MIRISHLYKTYGQQVIHDDFSCRFEEGKKYLIAGESGIGKTTLLRMIAGLEAYDQGSIEITGEKSFAVVFQEDRLIEDLSAAENVRLVNPLCSDEMIRRELSEILPEDQLDKPVSELSGGMRRRTALVRAMLNDGRIVILDEPFAGLDEENRRRALAYIDKKQNGRTILLCSHEDDDLNSYIRIDLENRRNQ